MGGKLMQQQWLHSNNFPPAAREQTLGVTATQTQRAFEAELKHTSSAVTYYCKCRAVSELRDNVDKLKHKTSNRLFYLNVSELWDHVDKLKISKSYFTLLSVNCETMSINSNSKYLIGYFTLLCSAPKTIIILWIIWGSLDSKVQ